MLVLNIFKLNYTNFHLILAKKRIGLDDTVV